MQGAPLEFSTFIADSLSISPSQTSAYLGVVLGFNNNNNNNNNVLCFGLVWFVLSTIVFVGVLATISTCVVVTVVDCCCCRRYLRLCSPLSLTHTIPPLSLIHTPRLSLQGPQSVITEQQHWLAP